MARVSRVDDGVSLSRTIQMRDFDLDTLPGVFPDSRRMKTRIQSVITTLALSCLSLFSEAEAVNPPPDGGYPGGNTAEGQNALLSLTTGTYNTAVGLYSLKSNTVGQLNTAVGASTLPINSAGTLNTAVGGGALASNTLGNQNTAVGTFALLSNAFGGGNTAIGSQALFHNATGATTGNANTAVGAVALFNNTIGSGILPWAILQALVSPPPITLSVSARMSLVQTWITRLGSATSMARRR
jgi:hypothetical protein